MVFIWVLYGFCIGFSEFWEVFSKCYYTGIGWSFIGVFVGFCLTVSVYFYLERLLKKMFPIFFCF